MAEVTATLPTNLVFGQRGVQTRDDFVETQEGGQDLLSGDWTTQANLMGEQMNAVKDEVNTLRNDTETDKNLADNYANANEDVEVETGKYSSKHFSIKSEASATEAEASATLALNASNYKGDWVADYNTTGYSQGMSVTLISDGLKYVSKVDTNLVEPTSETNTTEWDFLEAVSPAELALKENITDNDIKLALKSNKDNPAFTGSITEEAVEMTGLAIEPDNGTVQYKEITGNETWTDGLDNGQSMTIVITGTATAVATITYPTMKWANEVPTLTDDDTLTFYKVNGVLYGTAVANI